MTTALEERGTEFRQRERDQGKQEREREREKSEKNREREEREINPSSIHTCAYLTWDQWTGGCLAAASRLQEKVCVCVYVSPLSRWGE